MQILNNIKKSKLTRWLAWQ